jgi:transposase
LIDALMARIAVLEAALAKPRKTSRNSHTPPSQDPGSGGSGGREKAKPKKPRPSRPGVSRRLAAAPDESSCAAPIAAPAGGRVGAEADLPTALRPCRHSAGSAECDADRTARRALRLRQALPCHAARRHAARHAVGPNIHALLAYLHHSHHVGFERLVRLARELFGLSISEGAIANALRRLETPLEAERAAIRQKLRAAQVVWSDETTTRIDGRLHWQWVFVTPEAVLHEIAPRRARAVTEAVMDGYKPAVWISDRYAGQQEMAAAHQVCLAHVLRDVQYAIDCGDGVFAPALAKLLAWTIAIGRRRAELKDSTLRQYRIKADCRLDRLLATPAPHPAGCTLQAQVKAWRTKFFVFIEDRRVSATNNVAEREIRPSVVFRKVTGGFRSEWGSSVHAGYRSITSTAHIAGQTAFGAIRDIAATLFAPAAQTL